MIFWELRRQMNQILELGLIFFIICLKRSKEKMIILAVVPSQCPLCFSLKILFKNHHSEKWNTSLAFNSPCAIFVVVKITTEFDFFSKV